MISPTYDNKVHFNIACSCYQNCTSLNRIWENICSSAMGNFCLHILSKVVDKTSTSTFILLQTAVTCLAEKACNNKHNNTSIQEFDCFKLTDQNSVKRKQFYIQITQITLSNTTQGNTINKFYSIKRYKIHRIFREWTIIPPNLISCTSHYVI